MRYKAVNKRQFLRIAGTVAAQQNKPSLLDVSKWGQYWETGAKELEKSAPGKLITAPVRILEAATGATTGILQEAPKVVRRASYIVPVLGVAVVVGGAAYLAYKFKKDDKYFSNFFKKGNV